MPAPFASYLRVYEPLVAFERTHQHHWRRYVADGRALSPLDGPAHQRDLVLQSLGVSWTRLPDLPDEAYVLDDEGVTLVCPWNLRVRVAEAAVAAREGVPASIADAFVPPSLAASAEQALADWESPDRVLEQGTPRLHEHASGWTVPIRWFAFVDIVERELSLTPDRRYLRYRTPMSRARRRAHRALGILRRAVGETPVTAAVEEGARWLEEFHPRSVVELDYGGLANVLSDAALRGDDSPRLVVVGLEALTAGDVTAATRSYERLIERWRGVQLLERCN